MIRILAGVLAGIVLGGGGMAVAAQDEAPHQTYKQALRHEGQVYKTPGQSWRWLPGDECSRWDYVGLGKKDRTNGKNVWSVRSRINKKIWHTYKVAPAVKLDQNNQC